MTSKGKQIRVSPATLKRLEELSHPGQSMDGVITEILSDLDSYKATVEALGNKDFIDVVNDPNKKYQPIPKAPEPPKTQEVTQTPQENTQ